MYRAYRHMGMYWGHTVVWGMYRAHTDVRGCADIWGHTDVLGCTDVWGSVQKYGAYRHMGHVMGAYRCMGMYRCMGPHRHMEDVWGIQMYKGAYRCIGAYRCMGGCTEVRGSYRCIGVQMWGPYRYPRHRDNWTYPHHACQLHLGIIFLIKFKFVPYRYILVTHQLA